MHPPYAVPIHLSKGALMSLTDKEQTEILTKVRAIYADRFTAADRTALQKARDAAVSFAWEGWAQLGVHPDGPYKGKALSFVDYMVRKFGKF